MLNLYRNFVYDSKQINCVRKQHSFALFDTWGCNLLVNVIDTQLSLPGVKWRYCVKHWNSGGGLQIIWNYKRRPIPRRDEPWRVSWWRHQMETFSALLAFCAGNSPLTDEFPAQWSVTWSLDVFFDMCLNRQSSKQWRRWWFETLPRSSWRHCNVFVSIVGGWGWYVVLAQCCTVCWSPRTLTGLFDLILKAADRHTWQSSQTRLAKIQVRGNYKRKGKSGEATKKHQCKGQLWVKQGHNRVLQTCNYFNEYPLKICFQSSKMGINYCKYFNEYP